MVGCMQQQALHKCTLLARPFSPANYEAQQSINAQATYGSELQPIEVLPPGSIKAAPPADTPVGVVDTPPQRPAREHAPSVNIKVSRARCCLMQSMHTICP